MQKSRASYKCNDGGAGRDLPQRETLSEKYDTGVLLPEGVRREAVHEDERDCGAAEEERDAVRDDAGEYSDGKPASDGPPLKMLTPTLEACEY